MHADVPQFIDVEDKIAGPLTWKQLLWMIGLLVLLIILYNIFTAGAFIMIAIPVSLIFVAFAFIKPYGQPMTTFVYYGVMHLFGPKIYVWKREVRTIAKPVQKPTNTTKKGNAVSALTLEDIESLAQRLDRK